MPLMEKLLGPYRPYLYALLRIVAGLAFAQHGAQKLFGVLGGTAVELTSQRGIAGIIEFVGGIMIALGLFTSPVAFIASGEMAVAYFQAHARAGSGRSRTAASSPCSTASSFCTSRRRDRAS